MKDLLWLMRKMSVSMLRKKAGLLFLVLPIAGVLLSMLIYGSSNGMDLRVGIVNRDGDEAVTRDAVAFVEGLDRVKVVMTDEETLKKDISEGKLDSGIVFGQGFAASVREGKPERLDILSVKGAQVTAYVRAMLNSFVGNAASIGSATDGDAAAFDRIYAAYREGGFRMKTETLEDTSNRKDVTTQSMGYLIAFMMFSAVNMSELILKEKENRTFLRLLSSPVRARTYVLANVTLNFIILTVQIVVTLIFMKTILGIDSGIPYGSMIASLLLFALASIGLSLLIVAFAKSSPMANALQNLIITPTCLLAGCYFPAAFMPDSVRKVANFIPQHWLLDTIDKLQNGSSFGSLYLNLGILLAFTAAFTLIAVYRFGRNNDTRMFV
ncbi:ABC transporter permease subunit [Cohnella sp. CFH 77786]|uniref:ABC transporter permease n=1 Tax=Cohnella sp. CFH 77786 TaxID=2662265 RepID=UPI001C60E306|nr:ABC transporter permease [Cohnella sp. CFH 77786]MBW5447137.1 ABC transporter permease subunit [Cohnella sp. CFH 77786]